MWGCVCGGGGTPIKLAICALSALVRAVPCKSKCLVWGAQHKSALEHTDRGVHAFSCDSNLSYRLS